MAATMIPDPVTTSTSSPLSSPPPPRVLVLYGSETGTAQDVAEQIRQMAWNRGLPDARSLPLDAFAVDTRLPQCAIVVFVVATTGDGEAPENMRRSWRALLRKSLPRDWLAGVQVAVFGLGDSSYAKYNAVARRLQARLAQLGATELLERGLGDDQHALGLFGALNPWLTRLWPLVLARFPPPRDLVIDDSPKPLPPRFEVTTIPSAADPTPSGSQKQQQPQDEGEEEVPAGFYSPPATALDPDAGLIRATVVENRRLTAADWTQDVRHLVLDLDSGTVGAKARAYPAGAIAVVYPENDPIAVDDLVDYVGLTRETRVRIVPLDVDSDPTRRELFPAHTTVGRLFTRFLDILGTPRRSFFERLSLFATDDEEREKLAEIASPEGADLLYDYCIREKKTYGEVLRDFPSARVPLAALVELIPRLQPRSYSISSSSRCHPGQLHLTIALVDFLTPYKRRRRGVCSTYVETLAPGSSVVRLWIKTGLFRPVDPRKDVILIGPGTGLAAMRAIAQERAAPEATPEPRPSGSTVLFFGCRHEAKDFLYGDELRAMTARGDLTELHTAFSRDQPHKVYVQTRLAEHKERVFELLTNGAYVYVAGSAKRMPTDVYEVLRDILRSVGKLSVTEAENAMKALARTKRYVVESWS